MGLLHEKPSSGYDLRKIFSSTSMGSFSDSPGAIYPALERLEKQGLLRAKIEEGSGLRRRKVYRPTPKGLAELKQWLESPLTRDLLIRSLSEVMLRFAFIEAVFDSAAAIRFLQQLKSLLLDFIPELKAQLDMLRGKIPLSGRLALECGIKGYEAQLEWASAGIKAYQEEK
jgi:DNA-binding PadR family transcriptional regulator